MKVFHGFLLAKLLGHMSEHKIKVDYHKLNNLILLIFSDSKNSFVLGKNSTTSDLNFFNSYFFLKDIESAGSLQFTRREVRKIWDTLINKNFEQITQLEDILNGTTNCSEKSDRGLFCFKIRDKKTRKYSKGGSSPNSIWTNQGKTWNQINHIKTHLNTLLYDTEYDYAAKAFKKIPKNLNPYKDAELVVLKEVKSLDIMNIEQVKDEVKKFKRCR